MERQSEKERRQTRRRRKMDVMAAVSDYAAEITKEIYKKRQWYQDRSYSTLHKCKMLQGISIQQRKTGLENRVYCM